MHSYLKSIGFSDISSKEKEEKLIHEIMRSATKKSMISWSEGSETQYVEFSCDFAEDIGVTVRGQLDEEGRFRVDHYFPYLIPRFVSVTDDVYIGKKSDSEAYAVMCDDVRFGVSLIFFLQNAVDYLRVSRGGRDTHLLPTKLAALASEGTILLPTKKSAQDVEQSREENQKRAKMFVAAKNGDQEAIDHLTMQDMDAYTTLTKRIREEDIFSIVDTSFAPFGMESEVYRILGIILSLDKRENTASGEQVYVMEIYCNHMVFDLCINARDLLGEPAVGRRFRGVIWLQGKVDFDQR